MHLTPLSPSLGAEIQGLDLSRDLSSTEVEFLRDALDQHGVLRIRGQQLSDEQLMAVSAHFGALDISPGYVQESDSSKSDNDAQAAKYVAVISNVIENGKPIGGLGDGEAVWHADMTYIASPPSVCALYALEVPPVGGDTSFLSLTYAFESLPEKLRNRVERLQLKHDATYNSAGEVRRGIIECEDPRHSPGWVHPLAFKHPRNGKKMLLLGRRRNASIVGLPLEESEALLDQLWAEATRNQGDWHQQWKVGDLIIWDNIATMHRRDSFPADSRRVMHRTQVLGVNLA